jgi:D-serine deaminase-like pyridoxal phosphate-dependent protein
MTFTNEQYPALRNTFREKRLPLAFVDLEAFDANVAYVATRAQGTGKTIRLGTKSIRCEALLRRILEYGPPYQGLLTYTVQETKFLADKGYDDFIIAYPSVQPIDLDLLIRLTRDGKVVCIMIDSPAHLEILSSTAQKAGVVLSVCLEVDMSYRPFGTSAVHLGLRRSPIRTSEQALDLLNRARSFKGVRIDGLMGYEGHIAGVNDDLPGRAFNNFLMRTLKKASVRELTNRRAAVAKSIKAAGLNLRFINGGGSGSLVSTLLDDTVTEVTVGSGFYSPGLFHHFKEVNYRPSAFFALQAVRVPAPDMVTCLGGGYIASGPTETSKAPLPVLPVGMQYLPLEGAGEVQTPLRLPRDCPEIHLGDPLFFQHAKAGELCERFDELYLLKNGMLVDVVKTYRGEGMNFL